MAQLDIYVENQHGTDIGGVVVKLVDLAGVVQAQETTDSSGHVVFDPPVGDYDIRMFKAGVLFDGQLGDNNASPQRVTVEDSANNYKVIGRIPDIPESTDTRLCLVSGTLVMTTLEPYRGRLVITPEPDTVRILDPEMLMLNSSVVVTDDQGRVEFPLPRNGVYTITTIEGRWKVYVPDRPGIRIYDLVFPLTELQLSTSTLSFELAGGAVPSDWKQLDVEVVRSDGWSGTWKDLGVDLSYDYKKLEVDISDPEHLQVRVISDGWSSDQLVFSYTSARGYKEWEVVVNVTVV